MNKEIQLINDLPEEFTSIAKVLQLDAQLLGDYSIKAVNGRQLQEVLGSTKDHTNWAKNQITRLKLEQGVDYEILSILGSPSEASREISLKKHIPQNLVQTYCFTIDAAKTIAMVSQSENGQAVRKYFLHMEKVAQQAYRGEYSDPIKVAHDRFQYITEKACSVADLLGYSEGHKRKEALEIAIKIEQDSGIAVAPAFLTNDPQAMNPNQTLSPFHGTHAAMVAVGSKGYSVSNIAHLFGLTSGTVINDILLKEGFQIKICSGKYKPTEKAKLFCNVRTLASGKHKGQDIIIEWLYDSNKVLRDVIEQGVAEIEAKRQQKLKSKTDVNTIDPRLQRYYRDVK